MADKKISDLNAITGANTADGDLFVIVDTSANETKSITKAELFNQDITIGGNLTVQGTTITIDSATAQTVDLGDNDKIRLGDGDDLQIYHDSATSTNKVVGSIDVTGTVTADGLTVDAAIATIQNNDVDNGATLRLDNLRDGSNWGANKVIGTLEYTTTAETQATEDVRASVELVQTSATTTYPDASALQFNLTSANTKKKAMEIASNGDISFYEDTGTTAKFFWDASAESLGIGTSSPNTTVPLTIEGSTSGIQFTDSDLEGNWNIVVNGGAFRIQQGNVGSAPTEAVRITSGGDVGIGNALSASNPTGGAYSITDPDSKTIVDVLRVGEDDGGTTGVSEIQIVGYGSNTDSGGGTLRFLNSRYSSTVAMIKGTRESANEGYLKFYTGNTSALSNTMTLNSNGTLLVGKTTTGGTTAGMGWLGNEYLQLVNTETGATDRCLLINRQSSEGVAIEIREANAAAGVIGTKNDDLYIGTGDTGIRFADSVNSVYPHNTSTNAAVDATISLGANGFRFNTIHLSNGVSFDESPSLITGSVTNKTLDDYEEGTFTPELADASTGGNVASLNSDQGYYTKIGNLVYITVICTDIDTTGLTAGNTLYFRGLPFTAVNQGELTVRFDRITFSGKFVTLSHSAATYARFFETISNAQDAALTVAAVDGTGSDIFVSGCFRV